MITGIGFGQTGEFSVVPGEVTLFDDDAADRGTVTADELGTGSNHDIGSVFEGPEQVRGGQGGIDDHGDAGFVGDGGDGFEVGHVTPRVTQGFEVDGAGIVIDGFAEVFGIALIDEFGLDAVLGERVVEQVIGSAIQAGRRNDILTGFDDVHDRQRFSSLSGGDRQGTSAPFEQCEAFFQHVGGGVHQAGVDVPEFLQAEQSGRVISIIKGVGGRLVDRNGAGIGGAVGFLTAMQTESR